MNGPAGSVRLLVADDHPLFREGVASLMALSAGTSLVGEAATGEEALELARDLRPDVVLMDLQMPGLGGIEATRAIVTENADVKVIVLTMLDDDESVYAAIRAGARGYVLKGAERGTLLRAIEAVARGEVLLGESVARRVLDSLGPAPAPPVTPVTADAPELEGLTAREREVLDLIAAGLRNGEIARRLVISERTVGNHITNIFRKLQVADRVQAALRGRDGGLGRIAGPQH